MKVNNSTPSTSTSTIEYSGYQGISGASNESKYPFASGGHDNITWTAAENSETFKTMPRSGILRNLYAKANPALAAAEPITLTVRKNGVDTTIVATIAGGAANGSDTTHTVTFVPGDEISIRYDRVSTATIVNWFHMSLEVV